MMLRRSGECRVEGDGKQAQDEPNKRGPHKDNIIHQCAGVRLQQYISISVIFLQSHQNGQGRHTVGISEKTRYPRLTAMSIAAGMRIASVGLTSTFQGQSGKEYSLPKRVSL